MTQLGATPPRQPCPGPNEPTPRPVARSSPGLTQQRSDDVCGSYVDRAGGSWLSFLASKFCYSCLFLSSGFIRSGSIPPSVLFSFPFSYLQSCVCPLLPLGPSELRASGLGIRGFLLLLFFSFLKLSVHVLLGPSGTLVPSGSLEGGSTLRTLLWVGVAVRRSGSAGV